MEKYTNAFYPDKINDLIDNEGNFSAEAQEKIGDSVASNLVKTVTLTKNEDGGFDFPDVYVGNIILIYNGDTLIHVLEIYMQELNNQAYTISIRDSLNYGIQLGGMTANIAGQTALITLDVTEEDIDTITVKYSPIVGFGFEI